MKRKWLNATEIFDEYEKRFAAARANKAITHPWEISDKEQIIDSAKNKMSLIL